MPSDPSQCARCVRLDELHEAELAERVAKRLWMLCLKQWRRPNRVYVPGEGYQHRLCPDDATRLVSCSYYGCEVRLPLAAAHRAVYSPGVFYSCPAHAPTAVTPPREARVELAPLGERGAADGSA